jgi:pilus assembly protein Flp/PilA
MTGQLLVSFGRLARRFHADQSGATAIEYGLIAAGIGAAIIAVVNNLGTTIKTTLWDKVGNAM